MGLTLKKNRRIAGPERDKIAAALTRRYERGASVRELTVLTGRSYGFVHKILVEYGVELRGRGGARERRDAPVGSGR